MCREATRRETMPWPMSLPCHRAMGWPGPKNSGAWSSVMAKVTMTPWPPGFSGCSSSLDMAAEKYMRRPARWRQGARTMSGP